MSKSDIKIEHHIILKVFFSNIMSKYIFLQNQLRVLIMY